MTNALQGMGSGYIAGDLQERTERLERILLEAHHRVKNNLQIIVAMLEVQMDERTQALSSEGVIRLRAYLRAVADLHDLLAHSTRCCGNEDRLSARILLNRLVQMVEPLAEPKRIVCQMEDLLVTEQQGSALAIVTHELVCNALKFGDSKVEVRLTRRGEAAVLEVFNDGAGFDCSLSSEAYSGLGRALVHQTAQYDLVGTVRYENPMGGGALAVVEFPLDHCAC